MRMCWPCSMAARVSQGRLRLHQMTGSHMPCSALDATSQYKLASSASIYARRSRHRRLRKYRSEGT